MISRTVSLAELTERARDVTARIVAVNAEREDAEAAWPAPAMRALADAGLMGLHVPHAQGGHQQGLCGLLAICEILARESASTALCYGMHCVGSAVIAAKATPYHQQRYLEPIARGEHITTLALSEPATGSFFWLPETRLTPEDGGLRVDGGKSFITNGGHADSYVFSTASFVDDEEEGTFSCVVVDREAPGLEWQAEWNGLGMRSNSSRGLRIDGAHVPAENLLGAPGDQLWYVFEVVAPYFLTAMAGTYLGVAAAAFEIARDHLGTRRQSNSGELLGTNPVLAHRLGELWIELESTRRLIQAGAEKADAGHAEALIHVLAGKAAAGDAAVHIANEAMTLTGGIGYRDNGKLGRLLRDARAAHVMSPTTDLLKTWVGRALLHLPLL